jgi:hypothetical protein
MDEAHKYLVDGLVAALHVTAPTKLIKFRPGLNLYLAANSLARMRDCAAAAKWYKKRETVQGLAQPCKRLGETQQDLEQHGKARGRPRETHEFSDNLPTVLTS